MGDTDALMLRMERDASLRSTIVQVAVLDGPIDHDRLRTKVLRGIEQIPRFRQVPVPSLLPGAPPRWENAPDFDVDYHLRAATIGGRRDFRTLLDEAARIGMQAFDPARPPWESHVLSGLEGGGGAAIQKIHHSLGDGIGLLELVLMFVDLEANPPEPPGAAEETVDAPPSAMSRLGADVSADARAVLSGARSLSRGVLGSVRHPLGSTAVAYETIESALRMLSAGAGRRDSLMRGRSSKARFDVLALPFGEMRAAAKRVGGKLNTAFLAGVTDGLARYHELHDSDEQTVTCAMPINLRGEASSSLGNHFLPARFEVPLAARTMTERLEGARDLTASSRAERGLSIAGPVMRVLNTLPRAALVPMFGAVLRSTDVVVSNVPGSPIQLYVAGARSTANYGFSPRAGAAVNITVISHIDELHVAINSDPAAVPDPEVFVGCLEQGFAEVCKQG
jgi:diacylglycerol O-acyltransferase